MYSLFWRLRCFLINQSFWWISIPVFLAFLAIVAKLFVAGGAVISWQYLFSAPVDAGRGGGILPILVSTGLILVVAIATVLPIGLASAVYLAIYTERGTGKSTIIGLFIDTIAAVPSIVLPLNATLSLLTTIFSHRLTDITHPLQST